MNIAEGCIPYRPGLKEEDSDAEQCRNLLLIAAAPELLEALERALKWMPRSSSSDQQCEHDYNLGSAAIRKAKGETP